MMGLLKKFGSHYAIERFGVMFLSLTVCMGLLVSSILWKKVEYDNRALSGNAIYTRSFAMSQSRTKGQITGIYTNNAHTKVMILLSFDDMSALPTDANDYSLIISGATKNGAYDELQSHPSAMIYTFGATGNMAIYLQDVNGFPSQLTQMYLRSNVNLTGDSTGSGDSFNRYNQALIYFNPGGAYATHADFLEKDEWSLFDMIEEVVTRSDEAALRLQLQDDLLQMAKSQIRIQTYRDRLESMNVVVPETPFQIDDTIYAKAKDGSTDDRLHYISSYGGGWVDDTETKGYQNKDVTFYLDSEYVIPGGFDFNWQNGRILTGYLESLTGDTSLSRWSAYLNEQRDPEVNDGGGLENFSTTMGNIQWFLTDGSLVNLSAEKASTQRERDIALAITDLTEEWQHYYELKVAYETDHLYQLLQLEADGRNAIDSYTVNVGENGQLLTIV